MSLHLLAALCDIFTCCPEDLITVTAADNNNPRKVAAGNVVEIPERSNPSAPGSSAMTDNHTSPPRPRGQLRTGGDYSCDPCHRSTSKIRIQWPDGNICGILLLRSVASADRTS